WRGFGVRVADRIHLQPIPEARRGNAAASTVAAPVTVELEPIWHQRSKRSVVDSNPNSFVRVRCDVCGASTVFAFLLRVRFHSRSRWGWRQRAESCRSNAEQD